MNFYGAFINGLREILAHKMRSLLSMSGIILGVAALVAMVSVVQGMVGQFKGFIEMQGGIEKITISTESLPKEQEHLQDSAPGLRMVDVDAIRKLVPSVSHISPEISIRWTSISRNGKEFNARVTGTMSDWLVINKRSVEKGRFLADADELVGSFMLKCFRKRKRKISLYCASVGKRFSASEIIRSRVCRACINSEIIDFFGKSDIQSLLAVTVAQKSV